MSYQQTKELHDLLFCFMGMFHEKFIFRFRGEYKHEGLPTLKKNHQKILNVLYQQEHQTSTELGKKLDIEKGSLTTLIDQLEEWGLVVRSNDSHDRRKAFISLSTSGRNEMENMMDFYSHKLNESFQDVKPEEMEQFVDSLKQVVQFMKKI